MKKNNHKKFNKTINPSGNEPPLGWWKFRKKSEIPPRKQSLQQFLEVHRIPASSLMHRPGKARRGVKVGFRFQLQDWFTSTSRQSPQVEKESDQST